MRRRIDQKSVGKTRRNGIMLHCNNSDWTRCHAGQNPDDFAAEGWHGQDNAHRASGSLLVENIDGCYFNVVGMSLFLLNRLLNRFGLKVL